MFKCSCDVKYETIRSNVHIADDISVFIKSEELKNSPHCLVRKPAGITVVISVGEGGLQLARRCNDRRVLHTHPLGISKGEGVAVMGGSVMKHHTWSKEIQCESPES